MAVPAPNLQFTVTPPGGSPVDYTSHLAYTGGNQQCTITQSFGRQGDTATFCLIEEHSGTPSIVIKPMSQVKLHDSIAGQTLFGGVVTEPGLCVLSPTLNEWDLQCTDYTIYADNALVRWPASGIQASDQIVIGLVNQAACGITAKRYADGGYVAPGPALPEWSSGWTTLSGAWRTLATLMGQVTPYGWYVDETLTLHFYDQDTAQNSGVTFTTAPSAGSGGSITEGHITKDSQFLYSWDGTSIRNQVLVQGASQVITWTSGQGPVDQFLANGTDIAWPLKWTVSGSPAPVLYVGGAATTVAIVASGKVPVTAWAVTSNARGGYFLVAQSPPAAGTLIQLWYSYQVPIIARANDTASQAQYTGPNGGVFAELISDTSLTSMNMALARAQQDRTEYAFAAERVTFNTTPEFMGWVRAGQTFTLHNSLVWDDQANSWGISDTFIVTANQVTFVKGGYRTCQLTAVRL